MYLRSFPQAVTLLFHGLFHGSFMILSPQTGFPTAACALPPQISATVIQLLNFQLLGLMQPFCSTAILPIVVIESLNTSVRVCFAQPSHSGAECDPRHRGAVFHVGKQPTQHATSHRISTGSH